MKKWMRLQPWGTSGSFLQEPRMSITPLERNKQNVMIFSDLMFNQCKPGEAIDRYTGSAYTQHNPCIAGRTN